MTGRFEYNGNLQPEEYLKAVVQISIKLIGFRHWCSNPEPKDLEEIEPLIKGFEPCFIRICDALIWGDYIFSKINLILARVDALLQIDTEEPICWEDAFFSEAINEVSEEIVELMIEENEEVDWVGFSEPLVQYFHNIWKETPNSNVFYASSESPYFYSIMRDWGDWFMEQSWD